MAAIFPQQQAFPKETCAHVHMCLAYLEPATSKKTGSKTAKATDPRYKAFLNTAGLRRSSFSLGLTRKFKAVDRVLVLAMGRRALVACAEIRKERRSERRATKSLLDERVKAAVLRVQKKRMMVARRRYMMILALARYFAKSL